MTERQRKIVLAINAEIKKLREALSMSLLSGTESASLSTAGNAQSYKRFSPKEYRIQIASLERAKAKILIGSGRRRSSPDFG